MRRRPRITPRKKAQKNSSNYFEEQLRTALCDFSIDEEVEKSNGFLSHDSVALFKEAREQLKKNVNCSNTGQINWIVLGQKYKIKALYRSFYPLQMALLEEIHICDGCFQYYMSSTSCERHMLRCSLRVQPPGTEIYRDRCNNISVFEVLGNKQKEYCCNLSLMTVVWIRDKVVCFDVEEFVYYVLTREVKGYCEVLGYFSKFRSSRNENLSCFCVFPCFQRMGLGRFLIDFSYLLSRMMRRPGGPEKPLSPLGRVAYKSYWFETIAVIVYKCLRNNLSITPYDISVQTGICVDDILETLRDAFTYDYNDIRNTAVCHIFEGKELAATAKKIIKSRKFLRAHEQFIKPEFKDRLLCTF